VLTRIRDVSHFFERYLEYLIKQYPEPLRVQYTSNLSGSTSRVYSNPRCDELRPPDQTNVDLKICVISPAFFARFVHYVHSGEAFDRECVFTDEKNRTVWVSSPELLYSLLSISSSTSAQAGPLSILQRMRWQLHAVLRCPPPAQVYPSSMRVAGAEDIRRTELSELDRFVMKYMRAQAVAYRRLCARLFLAQRLAFGFVQILDLIDFAFRASLAWLAAGATVDICNGSGTRACFLLMALHVWGIMKSIGGA
jgi:hypothetical protein